MSIENLNIPGYTGTGGGFVGGSPTISGGLNIPAPGQANIPPQLATATAGSPTSGGFFDALGNIVSGVGGFLSDNPALVGAGAGGVLAQQGYQRLGDIGERARREASALAQESLQQTQFKPFTVTTATGGMFGTTPEGGTTMALSPQEQALQQQLLGGAGQFYGQALQPTVTREQDIYNRMRAAMAPEEQRQRLATEERLAAQGRLGLQSAAYGGSSPELMAMATAQQEARDRAMLAAMQQAQQEQMQQAQLGQQYLTGGYIPQAQLLAAAEPGLMTSQIAQKGQLTGAELFGEAEMSGLQALLGAGVGQADILGQIGAGLLTQSMQPQTVAGQTSIPVVDQFGNIVEAGRDVYDFLFGSNGLFG